MNDQLIASHYNHLDIFVTFYPITGRYRARMGTRHQSNEGGPNNHYGYGNTIIDAITDGLTLLEVRANADRLLGILQERPM